MRFKTHNTKKEIKFHSLFYLIFTVIGFFASVIFFSQNELMNGLIFLSIMIMMWVFAKQSDDDLNQRSIEEFLCKINNKKWEDYCNCEKCKSHSLDDVEDKN